MGLMDVPKGADNWMTWYSYFLKAEGCIFMVFWFVAYWMKFGFVWRAFSA